MKLRGYYDNKNSIINIKLFHFFSKSCAGNMHQSTICLFQLEVIDEECICCALVQKVVYLTSGVITPKSATSIYKV